MLNRLKKGKEKKKWINMQVIIIAFGFVLYTHIKTLKGKDKR